MDRERGTVNRKTNIVFNLRHVYAGRMLRRMNDVLTLQEAAALLRVTERTLHAWVSKGRVPAAKIGGVWRFSRAQLMEVIEGVPATVEETVTRTVRRG